MRLRKILGCAVLGAVLCTGGRAAEAAGFPERKTFQFGEFTIEASAGDEPWVEVLALKLSDFKPELPAPPPPPKLTLDDLRQRRDYFLGRVAANLGLAQPTEKMATTFDTMVGLWRTMRLAAPPEVLRRYALWRKPELVARIQAGEKIPGFRLDAAGGLDFSFEFKLDAGAGGLPADGAAARIAGFWDGFVCPIKIGAIPGAAPAEEVSTGVEWITQTLHASFGDQMQAEERQIVFNVLHETTESGVVWHYLTSKDRRWFCDGVANYVAWKVVQDEIGSEFARGYYDLPAELKKYESEAAHIDLAAWPAAEDLVKAGYAEKLNTANYAFATKVIADVCAKHGDDFLPKLFAEVGRTKREKATIETVYKAYHRLTREDLRAYLHKPASKD